MKRYWSYFKYVIKHKWYVFKECVKMGRIWRGILHDLSKFLPDEFVPYAIYFYNSDGSKRIRDIQNMEERENFDMAWLKHQHRNPHHWQYWILKEDDGGTKAIFMKDNYRDEMFCDWVGAGIAITGKQEVDKWYDITKNNRILEKNTLEVIEKYIDAKRLK